MPVASWWPNSTPTSSPRSPGSCRKMFGVRSIPFCVLFKDGQPVDGFVGALPEAQVRAFLDKHLPSIAERPPSRKRPRPSPLMAQVTWATRWTSCRKR